MKKKICMPMLKWIQYLLKCCLKCYVQHTYRKRRYAQFSHFGPREPCCCKSTYSLRHDIYSVVNLLKNVTLTAVIMLFSILIAGYFAMHRHCSMYLLFIESTSCDCK